MATDYCVYVIKLRRDVWTQRAKIRKANRDYDPETGRGCVYVGATSLTPEQRFAKHKTDERGSRVVRDFGVKLRRGLYARLKRMPEKAAGDLERELADRLRDRGFAVWPIAEGGVLNLDR